MANLRNYLKNQVVPIYFLYLIPFICNSSVFYIIEFCDYGDFLANHSVPKYCDTKKYKI